MKPRKPAMVARLADAKAKLKANPQQRAKRAIFRSLVKRNVR